MIHRIKASNTHTWYLLRAPRTLVDRPTFVARPQKLATFVAKLGQLVRGADENTFFWRVFARFLSCFLLFHGQFVYEMPFLQKKSSHLTFSSRRSASYKVPPRIGGHHFLLCQQTNTKDIAGQSAKEYIDESGNKSVIQCLTQAWRQRLFLSNQEKMVSARYYLDRHACYPFLWKHLFATYTMYIIHYTISPC